MVHLQRLNAEYNDQLRSTDEIKDVLFSVMMIMKIMRQVLFKLAFESKEITVKIILLDGNSTIGN